MGIITAGSLAKLMRPGLRTVFGTNYEQYPNEWAPLFELNMSKLIYEEETMVTTMGLARSIAYGEAVSYDDFKQYFTTRYTHVQFGLGFIVTEQEVEDNLHFTNGDIRSAGLAYSLAQTKNYNGANVFNYAFDTSGHPGADGVSFINDSHPTENGVFSNTLSVGADFSEASLEELLLNVYDCRDNRGKKMALREKFLLIPSDLQFEATRLLKNPQQPYTAERNINAMNIMGRFPEGILVNHFLTDPEAWFIKTTCPNGAKYFERRALRFDQDNDFATSNMHFKVTERYVFGVSDPRCYFGVPGA